MYTWIGNDWKELPGRAHDVVILDNGDVWCCTYMGNIYRLPRGSQMWHEQPVHFPSSLLTHLFLARSG
jgi:hypothetical protein